MENLRRKTHLVVTGNAADDFKWKCFNVEWNPDKSERKYIATQSSPNEIPYIRVDTAQTGRPGLDFFTREAKYRILNIDAYGETNDPRYDAHMKHYTPNNTKPTGRPPTVCDWIHWITVMNEGARCEWDMVEPLQDTPSNTFWTSGLPGARFVSRKTGLIADVFKHKDFIQVYFSLYHNKGWCCNNEGLSTWGYRYASIKSGNSTSFNDGITASLKTYGFWMLE